MDGICMIRKMNFSLYHAYHAYPAHHVKRTCRSPVEKLAVNFPVQNLEE